LSHFLTRNGSHPHLREGHASLDIKLWGGIRIRQRPCGIEAVHAPAAIPFLEHFFEEVDTGSSKENSVNQELRMVDLIQSDRQPL
jgi:hypothetical protein